jgi:hypothetical protein
MNIQIDLPEDIKKTLYRIINDSIGATEEYYGIGFLPLEEITEIVNLANYFNLDVKELQLGDPI